MSRSSTSSRFSDEASASGAEQQCRPKVCEQFETRAQIEQPAFRALLHRQRIPLRAAYRAEQHRVGCSGRGKRRCRQRRAVLVDGAAAQQRFVQLQFEARRRGGGLHHPHGLGDNFRTDAVARQESEILFHNLIVTRYFLRVRFK